MASVAFHHSTQFKADGRVRLFGAYGGYGAGEQVRDFIHVDDVVAVNLWFLAHGGAKGVFNVGTGRAQPFNDVAHTVVSAWRSRAGEAPLTLDQMVSQRLVEYVDFPRALMGKYQCFTQADLTALRAIGCDHRFMDVASGVKRYVDWLAEQPAD
jgi:ADP-L-glycero-D-manno-heptose 6-epimerase